MKLGLGGKAGNGKQMVSWLGETDFVRALDFLIENPLKGAFNFANPYPISNEKLMKEMRNKHQIPLGIPAPKFILKIAANMMGTSPELILRSQNVLPKRLLKQGFELKQNKIDDI